MLCSTKHTQNHIRIIFTRSTVYLFISKHSFHKSNSNSEIIVTEVINTTLTPTVEAAVQTGAVYLYCNVSVHQNIHKCFTFDKRETRHILIFTCLILN